MREQTLTANGADDESRIAPVPQLDNYPYPERALPPVISCKITGAYRQGNEQKVQTWSLPCDQFDQIDTNDRVLLEVNRAGQATLQEVLGQ
jgi:hypothetical protein